MRVRPLQPSTPFLVTFLSFLAVCSCSQPRDNSSYNVAEEHFHFSIQPGSRPLVRSLSREKRAPRSDTRRTPYSSDEEAALLKKHNELRDETDAADMLMMEWDKDLQKEAQRWADKCDFAHPKGSRRIGRFSYVGQNLYVSTHEPKIVSEPVQLWYDEIIDYTYSTNIMCKPKKMCGHYTQIVWAKSEAVGCAIKYCDTLSSVGSFNKGYLVVCEYGPGGNIIGRYPYQKGKACTQCPDKYKFCTKNLCSIRPYAGSGGGDGESNGGKPGTQGKGTDACSLNHLCGPLVAVALLIALFASAVPSYL